MQFLSSHSAPPIRLHGVGKSFREGGHRRVVFDGLSAELAGGRFTALVGRSGSGKSTLLNIVSGIELPDTGEVYLGERCVSALTDRERTLLRRHHVGFVFQFFNLLPTLTVEENLRLPLELCGERREPARTRALEVLGTVGLADRARSFPDRLSGGEQQRVAIARALVHRPGVVLADEPTGNLDGHTATEVLDLLQALVRERGATLVMATHSAEAAARADRVLAVECDTLRPRECVPADPQGAVSGPTPS